MVRRRKRHTVRGFFFLCLFLSPHRRTILICRARKKPEKTRGGCLGFGASCRPQRMLGSALTRTAWHGVVNDTTAPLPTRRRLRQCSQEGALQFQVTTPWSSDHQLTDESSTPLTGATATAWDEPMLRPGRPPGHALRSPNARRMALYARSTSRSLPTVCGSRVALYYLRAVDHCQ